MKNYSIGLVTGILLTASALMFMGANSKNMGDITADRITLVSEFGETQIIGGGLFLSNPNGRKPTVLLGTGEGGYLSLFNKDGTSNVSLGSDDGGSGIVSTYNKHGVEVAVMSSSVDGDGLIGIYDRYGEAGWGETGKQ